MSYRRFILHPSAFIPPLLLGSALAASACLGTLRADPTAEAIARVPQPEIGLVEREHRRHWLLRGESGWCGSYEVRYGGDPEDPAVATIRTVVLRTPESAMRAHGRLTPTYLYRALSGRMTGLPQPFDYPERLDGDEVAVYQYDVRLPFLLSPDLRLVGQLTVIRAGRVVFLIESIGVSPEQLVPAVRELVRAANRLPETGKC